MLLSSRGNNILISRVSSTTQLRDDMFLLFFIYIICKRNQTIKHIKRESSIKA